MRKVILCVVAVACILCSCCKEIKVEDNCRLRKIESPAMYEIWVDTETGVCYVRSNAATAFTVLVDHNGNPYIANGWRDWSDGDALY